jgi:uncharacterized RDD family membrane protein YckC
MICPRCAFQNRKGTLACARCGEAAPKPIGVMIDSRPPEEGVRSGVGSKRELPFNRRGTGLRAISGGPAAVLPPPRIRPTPPRWETPNRAESATPPPTTLGDTGLSEIHHAKTDPQWMFSPDPDRAAGRPTMIPGAPQVQEVVVPETVGLRVRALAGLIDAGVVLLCVGLSMWFGFMIFGWQLVGPQLSRGVDFTIDGLLIGRGLLLWLGGLALVFGFAYTTVAHALAGATLGKALLGLHVVTADGECPRPGESAWRSVLAGSSLALGCIGVAVAIVDPLHLALHDRLVGTRVVPVPTPTPAN